MKELYDRNLEDWREVGGNLFCLFSSMGRYRKWGSWGLLEHDKQDRRAAPKYRAVADYLERLERNTK